VRFLPLARLITGGLPLMDSTTLMALEDRWRLETHMFHLACGETTVTLQDITMILGLPIESTPVCGPMSPWGMAGCGRGCYRHSTRDVPKD
jgi:hypothetical protein